MHYGGHPCRPEVLDAAREQGLVVIEDAAHALGGSGRDGPCGSWGDVGCFSFFANKNLPLGEGGMLVTDDPELAERALRLRSHGMTTATWERHTGAAPTYDVLSPAHNFRFDEPRAAMGTTMLRELAAKNELRGGLIARYRGTARGGRGRDGAVRLPRRRRAVGAPSRGRRARPGPRPRRCGRPPSRRGHPDELALPADASLRRPRRRPGGRRAHRGARGPADRPSRCSPTWSRARWTS